VANSIFQIKKDKQGKPVFLFKEGGDSSKNAIASDIVKRLNSSAPGQYQQILTQIQNKHGGNVLKNTLSKEDINQINSFYTQKNVSTKWDPNKLGAKPPTGEFDSAYYKEQVPEVSEKWNEASKGFSFAGTTVPNLDVTERYADENSYLQYHYTSQGKQKNIRANPAQVAADAEYYTEKQQPITDAERQAYRDQLSGLFESKDIQDALQGYVDTKGEERFEAMRQSVLKQTIAKLNAAKGQEDQLDFFKNMPGVSEIYNFGSTVSNEILGDSGLGGYLSMTGQSGLKEDIENMFSPGNSAVYNWQKWFDEELTEQYRSGDGKLTVNKKEYEIAKEEAQAFIDDYLKPRFDYSRSMDEFVSYLDVSNDQQNVLQTQTLSNKIKELTKVQTDSYLNKLQKGNQIIGIDTEYYFNTGGKKPYQDAYVNIDWENAKKYGDTASLQRQGQGEKKTWAEWAYQYGLDLNKKDDFAKLHYELRGKSRGYDPRKDSIDPQQVAEYVSESILPYIAEEAGKVKNVFLDFVKPEEYLNTLSGDYNFFENEDVKELLEKNDIDPSLYDEEEINNMFAEVLRTVPAETIRKQIEELNKKKKKPTQELLGVSYIEREEDVKDIEEESQDAVYNLFKQAGFEGDEDEFKDFIGEDFSMEGMDLISEFSSFDFSDPMKSLSKLQSLSSFEQDDAESEYNKIFEEAEKKDMDFMSSLAGSDFGMDSFFF